MDLVFKHGLVHNIIKDKTGFIRSRLRSRFLTTTTALESSSVPLSKRTFFSGNNENPIWNVYMKRISDRLIKEDEYQINIVRTLQKLDSDLRYYQPPTQNLWTQLIGSRLALPPKGLYLHGSVGCGKTFLMDLFYDNCSVGELAKQRIHFHRFMLDVHSKVHQLKQNRNHSRSNRPALNFNPIPHVAKSIASNSWLLCLDEFQVTDVVDAMILKQLFYHLFEEGVILVATSNRAPDDLYKSGLQRSAFLPFIAMLKDRCTVKCLDSNIDYRKSSSSFKKIYFLTTNESHHRDLDNFFNLVAISENDIVRPRIMNVNNRSVHLRKTCGGIVDCYFSELCEQPLGADDYDSMGKTFHTVMIRNIPQFNMRLKSAARRFITLIDILYDAKTRVVFSADVPLSELFAFHSDDGHDAQHLQDENRTLLDDLGLKGSDAKISLFTGEEEIFALDRTVSRITEMQTNQYWDSARIYGLSRDDERALVVPAKSADIKSPSISSSLDDKSSILVKQQHQEKTSLVIQKEKHEQNKIYNYNYKLDQLIKKKKDDDSYRIFRKVRRFSFKFPYGTEQGRNVIIWCSNDYFGMSSHPGVREAIQQALDKYGAGSGGTRNIAGNSPLHENLEHELADLHEKEAALIFSSCYVANDSTLFTLAKLLPDCEIFSDAGNHASMIQGIRNSGARKHIFRTFDPIHLEEQLQQVPISIPKIVAFETVHSMTGDVSPVEKMCDISHKYGALTFVDEVHAVGLYGEKGAGIAQRENCMHKLDIISGTLGKAYGNCGGYIASNANLIDVVRSYAAGFIFTTSLPPTVVCGATESVRILKGEEGRRLREMQQANVFHMKRSLTAAGLPHLPSRSHIIPIPVGDAAKCAQVSDDLLEQGHYIQSINYPTVARGTERLRVSVTPFHNEQMIDELVERMVAIWRANGLNFLPSVELVGKCQHNREKLNRATSGDSMWCQHCHKEMDLGNQLRAFR